MYKNIVQNIYIKIERCTQKFNFNKGFTMGIVNIQIEECLQWYNYMFYNETLNYNNLLDETYFKH